MCWCTPEIRTPHCGKIDCHPPASVAAADAAPPTAPHCSRCANMRAREEAALAAATKRNATIRTLTAERDDARKRARIAEQSVAGYEACLTGLARIRRYEWRDGVDIVARMFEGQRRELERVIEFAQRDREKIDALAASIVPPRADD